MVRPRTRVFRKRCVELYSNTVGNSSALPPSRSVVNMYIWDGKVSRLRLPQSGPASSLLERLQFAAAHAAGHAGRGYHARHLTRLVLIAVEQVDMFAVG